MLLENLNPDELLAVSGFLGIDDSRVELLVANRRIHDRFPRLVVCDLDGLLEIVKTAGENLDPEQVMVNYSNPDEAILFIKTVNRLSPLKRYMFYRTLFDNNPFAEGIASSLPTGQHMFAILESAWMAHDHAMYRLIAMSKLRQSFDLGLILPVVTIEYADMFPVALDLFKPPEADIAKLVLKCDDAVAGAKLAATAGIIGSHELLFSCLRDCNAFLAMVAESPSKYEDLRQTLHKVCRSRMDNKLRIEHMHRIASACTDDIKFSDIVNDPGDTQNSLFCLFEAWEVSKDCLDYLIRMGGDVKVTNRGGITLLDWAARNRHYDLCKYLVTSYGLRMSSLAYAVSGFSFGYEATLEFTRFVLDTPGCVDMNAKQLVGPSAPDCYESALRTIGNTASTDVLELVIERGIDLTAWAIDCPNRRVTVLHLIIDNCQNRYVTADGSYNKFYDYHSYKTREEFVEMARICLSHVPILATVRGNGGKLPFDLVDDHDYICTQLRQVIKSVAGVTPNPLLTALPKCGDCSAKRERVQELLDQGVDIDGVVAGVTALAYCACLGHRENVEILLECGASIFKPDGSIPNALVAASGICDNLDIVRDLYDIASSQPGFDINALDRFNSYQTGAIHEATGRECKPILQFLLGKGADPNLRSGKLGITPLMSAFTYIDTFASLDIGRMLIESKADVNARDRSGRTALFTCVLVGSSSELNFLLSNGADPSIPDNDGTRPIDLARFICKFHPQLAQAQQRKFFVAVRSTDDNNASSGFDFNPAERLGIRNRLAQNIDETEDRDLAVSDVEFARKYRLDTIYSLLTGTDI